LASWLTYVCPAYSDSSFLLLISEESRSRCSVVGLLDQGYAATHLMFKMLALAKKHRINNYEFCESVQASNQYWWSSQRTTSGKKSMQIPSRNVLVHRSFKLLHPCHIPEPRVQKRYMTGLYVYLNLVRCNTILKCYVWLETTKV
jgi:hypothetical protein